LFSDASDAVRLQMRVLEGTKVALQRAVAMFGIEETLWCGA
jgi:hypothetical protein